MRTLCPLRGLWEIYRVVNYKIIATNKMHNGGPAYRDTLPPPPPPPQRLTRVTLRDATVRGVRHDRR